MMPAALAAVQLGKTIRGLFVADWMSAGPGRVFFQKPDGMLQAFLWDCCLIEQMFIGQFYLTGTHRAAVAHTWYDWVLTKPFWRATFEKAGATCPACLGDWDGKQLTMHGEGIQDGDDLVVKLPDSYLGIGDSFWRRGKDFKTVDDVREHLAKEYDGKAALILDLARPHKQHGVHSFDIVTIRTPDGGV